MPPQTGDTMHLGGIIAALLSDPDLLVFDEPLSGLDVTSMMVFRHLLQALSAAGKAILYSSHVLEVVEKVCVQVIILDHGRIVADGPRAQILQ